jgi:hypothetical protein
LLPISDDARIVAISRVDPRHFHGWRVNQMTDSSGHADLFADYIDENTVARMRKCSIRHLREERLRGDGPPFVKIDRNIYYSISGFKTWLETITTKPVRVSRRARPAIENASA